VVLKLLGLTDYSNMTPDPLPPEISQKATYESPITIQRRSNTILYFRNIHGPLWDPRSNVCMYVYKVWSTNNVDNYWVYDQPITLEYNKSLFIFCLPKELIDLRKAKLLFRNRCFLLYPTPCVVMPMINMLTL